MANNFPVGIDEYRIHNVDYMVKNDHYTSILLR